MKIMEGEYSSSSLCLLKDGRFEMGRKVFSIWSSASKTTLDYACKWAEVSPRSSLLAFCWSYNELGIPTAAKMDLIN